MQFKVYYLVAQGRKKLSSSKNGRFRPAMIAETQPEVESLEVVAYIYPFLLKFESSIPSTPRIYFCNAASLDYMCSSRFSLKNPDIKIHAML